MATTSTKTTFTMPSKATKASQPALDEDGFFVVSGGKPKIKLVPTHAQRFTSAAKRASSTSSVSSVSESPAETYDDAFPTLGAAAKVSSADVPVPSADVLPAIGHLPFLEEKAKRAAEARASQPSRPFKACCFVTGSSAEGRLPDFNPTVFENGLLVPERAEEPPVYGVCTRPECTYAHSLAGLYVANPCNYGDECRNFVTNTGKPVRGDKMCRYRHPCESTTSILRRLGRASPCLPESEESNVRKPYKRVERKPRANVKSVQYVPILVPQKVLVAAAPALVTNNFAALEDSEAEVDESESDDSEIGEVEGQVSEPEVSNVTELVLPLNTPPTVLAALLASLTAADPSKQYNVRLV